MHADDLIAPARQASLGGSATASTPEHAPRSIDQPSPQWSSESIFDLSISRLIIRMEGTYHQVDTSGRPANEKITVNRQLRRVLRTPRGQHIGLCSSKPLDCVDPADEAAHVVCASIRPCQVALCDLPMVLASKGLVIEKPSGGPLLWTVWSIYVGTWNGRDRGLARHPDADPPAQPTGAREGNLHAT